MDFAKLLIVSENRHTNCLARIQGRENGRWSLVGAGVADIASFLLVERRVKLIQIQLGMHFLSQSLTSDNG
ncbi:hypothetical protein [Rhodopirellula sallentina]|uniref:Uncharacterized protein n=1 Tax=Rhodopirellula sallentina SM41 TaxID=1263870 RepID=M5TVS2_9BACT|nr:hypothetical protein [Rhodopirellula sallentina]EMI53302.1 hypothetical protein RSSM_05275 [Rhodopirellula sallentina SM41]